MFVNDFIFTMFLTVSLYIKLLILFCYGFILGIVMQEKEFVEFLDGFQLVTFGRMCFVQGNVPETDAPSPRRCPELLQAFDKDLKTRATTRRRRRNNATGLVKTTKLKQSGVASTSLGKVYVYFLILLKAFGKIHPG